MNKKLEVKCPNCDNKFFYYDSEYRPFCSEKCKMIDLGSWLSGDYVIHGPPIYNSDIKDNGDDEEE